MASWTPSKYRGRLCRRRKVVGLERSRPGTNAGAQFALRLRSFSSSAACHATSRPWIYRQRGCKGGLRSWSGCRSIRRIQGCRSRAHGFSCRRLQGNRRACELHSSEHHRYSRKPKGNARCRLRNLAEPEDIAAVVLFFAVTEPERFTVRQFRFMGIADFPSRAIAEVAPKHLP